MPETNDPVEAAEKSAGKYAWEHFRYHAGQRQAVFRFFLTLIGIATVAYGYSLRGSNGTAAPPNHDQMKFVVGLIYVVTSFLFWRLDRRSRILIQLAESALKETEAKLSAILKRESICLMKRADEGKTSWFPLSYLESFRQIYCCIFLLVALAGLYLIQDSYGWLIAEIR